MLLDTRYGKVRYGQVRYGKARYGKVGCRASRMKKSRDTTVAASGTRHPIIISLALFHHFCCRGRAPQPPAHFQLSTRGPYLTFTITSQASKPTLAWAKLRLVTPTDFNTFV